MADLSSSSKTIGEHMKLQRQMKNLRPTSSADEPLIPKPNRVSKSAMSSLFLLPATSSSSSNDTTRKKKANNVFHQTTSFRGLGCTSSASSHQVSVPAVIRSSADWDATISKIKKSKKKKKGGGSYNGGSVKILTEVGVGGNGCAAIPDVWCGPGVGFSTDAVVIGGGSIDLVESDPPRRNIPTRRKIDVDKTNSSSNNNNSNYHREASSSVIYPRGSLNQESNPYFDSDSTFLTSRTGQALFSDRYHRRLRQPDGLSEMMMVESGYEMGGILSSFDHFRDMRLNIDGMTYEQLLELGDRIGYVNTGLNEKQIKSCLRKVKPYRKDTPLADRKCIICQEEYEVKDQVGKLRCEHRFHIECVKQWLSRKNSCPICKTRAKVLE